MNLLLDTHALLWWFVSPSRLSDEAKDQLKNSSNIVYVSAAVAWELAIKTSSGKLDAQPLLADFSRLLFHRGFRRLAISTDHALRAGQLPTHHKDPFDRMLVAQAQAHALRMVSADSIFDRYGVARVW